MRRIELLARWATTTRLSIRLHPPRWAVSAPCIREVLTLRLPRCERGALPLSYGCLSARPVSNEALRCIRAASSPADSGPLGDGGHRVFRKPDLRRVVPALCL